MEIDQEILDEFHTEADESLDALEQDLIKLESVAEAGESDPDLIDRIFRVLHTLKGGAGFLGLDKMNKLAHAGENLLDEVRGGQVEITTDVMDALLETNDLLKDLLECSKSGENPETIDFGPLKGRLETLSSGGSAGDKTPEDATDAPPEEAAPAAQDQGGAQAPVPAGGDVEVNEDLLAEIMADDKLGGEAVPDAACASDVEINEELLAEINGDDKLAGGEGADPGVEVNQELLAEISGDDRLEGGVENTEAKPEAKPKADAPKKFERREGDRRGLQQDRRKKPGRRDGDPQEVTIRVDTARLDNVMNLVGELVLARNGLQRQLSREDTRKRLEGSEYLGAIDTGLESFARVSKALQMSVLHTRMQPIKRVFDKIPRQVRELKNKLEKDVNLVIEGEGTEVDRTLVEELADPMVHLIRNALDHGLEGPEERKELGKNPVGTLTVRAFYEGNNVVIQVADDGRGIDADIVKNKALEKRIISAEQAEKMSDKEAHKLIMAAGFSTATEVSDVSGRGVGMDVVSNKISKINGTIDLESELGSGTTISIYLPLTLAIVQALIVGANDEGFAIPIGSISEVIKFHPQDVHNVNSQDAIELREEVIPIRYLGELTRKGRRKNAKKIDPEASTEAMNDGYVIIVRDSNMIMGLVIDKLIGQEEAVVKSITNAFEFNPAISGATISGDGHVHMILDIPYFMRESVRKNQLQAPKPEQSANSLPAEM